MIVHPSTPGGYATFCDDIRDEVGGKVTLVGIYAGEMNVSVSSPVTKESPAIIPMLCCMAYVNLDPAAVPKSIAIEMRRYVNGSEALVLTSFSLDNLDGMSIPPYLPITDDAKHSISLSIALRISPFIIDGEFLVRTVAIMDGDEYRLGSLAVRPSSQAPTPA